VHQRFDHDEVRARSYRATRLRHNQEVGDYVPQVARAEHGGLEQRERAVCDHCTALTVDQTYRTVEIEILAADYRVEPIFGEAVHPGRQILPVQLLSIVGVESVDLGAQQQRLQPRVECRVHRAITSRQCRYMARIADSEISVSEVPKGTVGLSATRCSPP